MRPAAVALDHVVLRAADGAGLARWYGEALGMRVAKHNKPAQMWHMAAGRALVDIVDAGGVIGRKGGPPPPPAAARAAGAGLNLDHLCLRVAPWEPAAVSAHLEKFGAAAQRPVTRFGALGDGESMYLTDPEGNAVEVRGPAPGEDDDAAAAAEGGAPFRVVALDHIVLRARDGPGLKRWYEGALGMGLAKHNEPVQMWHLSAGDRCLVDIVDAEGPLGKKGGPPPPDAAARAAGAGLNMDHFCIRVAPFDVDAVAARLADAGVTQTHPPATRYGAMGDGLSVYFTDPEGNSVELRAAAPGDSPRGPVASAL